VNFSPEERWKSAFFSLLITPLFCTLLFIPVSAAGLQGEIYETVLHNGLKIILLENRKAPVATFQVWYRVGSRNENLGKTGLSHLLEHMMFKGTERFPPERFVRTIQENGGIYNAFTSQDFTAYFETLSADRLEISFEIEADRMRNLAFREDDFRTERMVVMEERRLRVEDDPRAYLFEQTVATAFQAQPYQWPIIGWMDDLSRISLVDAKDYYRSHYHPSNAFIVAVGDFKKEEILPKIEEAFGPIPGTEQRVRYRYKDPPQTGERRIYVKREAMLPFILMGYHVPTIDEPESYALEVLAALLSAGKSSRLYRSLVLEKQLARAVDADHSLLSHDPSLIYFSADPLPGKDVSEIERAVYQEIERLQEETVREEELQKAKNQLEAVFLFAQDSIFYQAMLLARHEIVQSWRRIDDYVPSIQRVSSEDVRRAARRYLIPENRTVGILIPLPPKEEKPGVPDFSIKGRMIR
jgi:zinc protease